MATCFFVSMMAYPFTRSDFQWEEFLFWTLWFKLSTHRFGFIFCPPSFSFFSRVCLFACVRACFFVLICRCLFSLSCCISSLCLNDDVKAAASFKAGFIVLHSNWKRKLWGWKNKYSENISLKNVLLLLFKSSAWRLFFLIRVACQRESFEVFGFLRFLLMVWGISRNRPKFNGSAVSQRPKKKSVVLLETFNREAHWTWPALPNPQPFYAYIVEASGTY